MSRKNNKEGRIVKYTLEGWKYMKESRNYIYAAALLFLISSFGGFVFAESLEPIYSEIIKSMMQSTSNLGDIQLGTFIFFSNFKGAFLSLFLGVMAGAFSLFNILLNGSLLGYVMRTLWDDSGAVHFWRILPHGIFELPALFISWGLGIKFGAFIFSRNPGDELKRRFEESLKTFFFIVVPLLIVAAIIEAVLIAVI